jgi:hypothetical protein
MVPRDLFLSLALTLSGAHRGFLGSLADITSNQLMQVQDFTGFTLCNSAAPRDVGRLLKVSYEVMLQFNSQ